MPINQEERIRKTRRKYGANCYPKWGKRGGNRYLLALKRGDKLVIRHKHK